MRIPPPSLHRLPIRAALLALLVGLLGLASGQCSLEGDPYEFEVEGFGTAFFRAFLQDPATDSARFRGDVCIAGEGGAWTILTDELRIEGLRGTLRLEIDFAIVLLAGWRLEAQSLAGDTEGIRLEDAAFRGGGVEGEAEAIEIDLGDGSIALAGVRARGESFRLAGARGRLSDGVLMLEEAVATTCLCAGEGAYRVRSAEAVLELGDGRIELRGGVLETGRLRIPLRERLELGPDALADVAPPVTLEYRGAPGGSGLGVVVPSLRLQDGLRLEAGVVGLDVDHAVTPFALLRRKTPSLEIEIGRARGGPRSRVVVREPLARGVTFEVGFANLHDPDHDFLHEGRLVLEGRSARLPLDPGASLELHGRALAAASSQALATPVTDLRLGLEGGAVLRARLPLGGLELAGAAEATRYPGADATQWGVRLAPRWSVRADGLELALGLDRRWTNGASPFTAELDRLEPRADLSAWLRYGRRLDPRSSLAVALDLRYDLLPGRRGLEVARGEARYAYEAGLWTLTPRLELELADLLAPAAPGAEASRLEAGVTARRRELELGVAARVALAGEDAGLDLLELHGAVPVELGEVTLRPFVAVDAAPFLRAGEPPRVSGHGLELTWRTCCGTLQLGYRQRANDFTTRFGLALATDPEPLW